MPSISKEEILLANHDGAYFYVDKNIVDGSVESVYDAMDEYAKQVAIGFADWLDENNYRRNRPSKTWFNSSFEFITDDQAYELYLKSIS